MTRITPVEAEPVVEHLQQELVGGGFLVRPDAHEHCVATRGDRSITSHLLECSHIQRSSSGISSTGLQRDIHRKGAFARLRMLTHAVFLVLCLFAAVALHNFRSGTVTASAPYAVGELVEFTSFKSCDLVIAPGPEPIVEWTVKTSKVLAASSSPTIFDFRSSRSCPAAGCHKNCAVRMFVPPSAHGVRLSIAQTSSDTEGISVTLMAPVRLAELLLCSNNEKCPTLALAAEGSSRIGRLVAFLVSGDIYASGGAHIENLDVSIIGGGSYYHLNRPTSSSGTNERIELQYRQPGNSICVGSDTMDVDFTLAGAWDICDVTALLGGTSVGTAHLVIAYP